MTRKHSHYFKPVPSGVTHIDVYRVLEMFGVTDQALGHAIKKLLVAGGRGAKDITKDVQEAVDTLQRRLEMWGEDTGVAAPYVGEDQRDDGRYVLNIPEGVVQGSSEPTAVINGR